MVGQALHERRGWHERGAIDVAQAIVFVSYGVAIEVYEAIVALADDKIGKLLSEAYFGKRQR